MDLTEERSRSCPSGGVDQEEHGDGTVSWEVDKGPQSKAEGKIVPQTIISPRSSNIGGGELPPSPALFEVSNDRSLEQSDLFDESDWIMQETRTFSLSEQEGLEQSDVEVCSDSGDDEEDQSGDQEESSESSESAESSGNEMSASEEPDLQEDLDIQVIGYQKAPDDRVSTRGKSEGEAKSARSLLPSEMEFSNSFHLDSDDGEFVSSSKIAQKKLEAATRERDLVRLKALVPVFKVSRSPP